MSSGRSNPLKPLIFGMLAMGLVAIGTLTIRGAISLQEQEARRQEQNRREREATQQRWHDEQAQRQAAEARRRSEAEAARLRREQEAAASLPAAASATLEKLTFDVSAGFEKMLHRAAAGDPHAQYVVGYVYFVGMDKIVQVRDSKVVAQNPIVLTALNGGMLGSRQIVSPPTFKRDQKTACSWLERAALQGHRGAQVLLAMAHLNNGQGDRKLAYQWLITCEGPPILTNELRLSNPPPAIIASMKENVRKRLTPEQVADAEKQAKSFQPKKENP